MAKLTMQEEASAPSTPTSGKWVAYFKAEGLFIKDDAGNEIGPLDASNVLLTTGGSSTAYTITTTPAAALTTGETFRIKFHTTAGATPTLNRDSKGAKSLKYYDSSGAKQACTSAQIIANMIFTVLYDGTDYVLLGGGGGSSSIVLSSASPRVYTSGATWSKPLGLHHVIIEVIGGGGAGGGAPATGGADYSAGGGGGGGGYSKKKVLAASLGSTETVTVGAGGTGSSGATGGSGGTSSFGSHCSATGGSGGNASTASAVTAFIGPGDSGIGSSGDINAGGHPGLPGVRSQFPHGGGGGGSQSGGGGLGQTTAAAFNGNAGKAYGGGGSGAANAASQTARAGAAGAAGVVIVWEYVTG